MSTIGWPAGAGIAPVRMTAGYRPEPSRAACLPEQRRLWVLERMDPGSPALNIAARWRLEGRVSGAELEQALASLVARHAALRTSFAEDDGEPAQWIHAAASCRLREVDLTAAPDPRTEVERIARIEGRAPFDLSAPPLMRVTHLRLRDDASVLLVTVHRLACDAASVGILARELCALCAALHAGRASDLPEAPPPGAGAAARGDAARSPARDETYWLRALRAARHFELPADRARPPARTFDGDRVSLRLDREVCEALQGLARRAGCGLFTTALAALFTLLHRYSGETDIAIGSPVAGRDEAELDAVGVFVNELVLRADLSGDPSFTVLLGRVQECVTAAFRHRSTPLGRLIELLRPQRDLSRHALFSIHFTFQPPATRTECGGAFCLVDEPAPPAGVPYDLDFHVADTGDGWCVSCEYNTALYDAATARGLLAHLANLLCAVAADPELRLSRLPLLDEGQRRALAEGCNRTAAAYPAAATVAKLFDGQARRTPGAIAVACGGRELSYRELDATSGLLADALASRGIGRGSRVGVCVERSADLVVALLAVLRSGAAYVPLDPGYPVARLAQIVGDARPAVVLTQAALRERLPAAAPLMLLDAAPRAPAAPRERASAPAPDDVAYVIYTSGSTGRPKGVQVRHRALTNLLWSMSSQPGLAAADTLVAVTTVSFDIAALELFLPLIVGARLVLAREQECADGGALLELLRREQATVLQATPVTWQLLLAAGWRGDPPLRMWCGGEALSRPLADRLLAGGGELWNLYGPTETTIWSSALRVEAGAGPVPIGPPIANTQFHVLDEHGQLVPAGVAGELFIGGDGVALGYLDLPSLTRERFVADVFREQPGARLYRTGDRVRRRPQGRFEFLGRADDQVKVRGFRIELGEIEAVMRAQPQVGDAVALAGPDAAGETTIRAWLVARDAAAPAGALVDGVRSALRQALPGYMCPASFAVLAALPRLPNGKTDRGALASLAVPDAAVVAAAAERAATPVERQLAQLWCAVLGIPAVGVDSNFFEVGGHSLLAVRLLARIEAAFGRRLSLAAVFRHPTIAGQARLLEHGEERAFDFRQVVALQPGGARPPLIAINNTGIYYALSKRLGPDQPFTSLQLFDPALPPRALPTTLPDIAAGYAQLIRRVHGTGPCALLGWCVAGTLAFEVARQLRRSGQPVSRLILFDTLAPGRLERLSWPAAVLAGYSYRWKLIAADWRRTRTGARPVAEFLSNRTIVRKLFGGEPRERDPPRDAPLTPGQYDQWLLAHLEEAAAAYQPRAYGGPVTLFRSSQEPAGRFLDPQMGWGEFVEGGLDVVVVEGDHFSIFQEPAVAEVARRIGAALAREGP